MKRTDVLVANTKSISVLLLKKKKKKDDKFSLVKYFSYHPYSCHNSSNRIQGFTMVGTNHLLKLKKLELVF